MSDWASLGNRMAGKWQLPLLVVSLILLAGAIYRIRPTPTRLPPAKAVEHLETLVAGGLYEQAIDFGDPLLGREEFSDADRAPVHFLLARARYGEARRRRIHTANAGRQIVDHFGQATSQGQALTADDHRIVGFGWEWQRRFGKAIEHFNTALKQGVERPLDLRKHLISLTLDQPDATPERSVRRLDQFLADVGEQRLDLRLWAIEKRIGVAEEMDALDESTTLLARNRDYFEESDLRDRFHYLEAWLLYRLGHHDEAETHLRTLRNRIERADELYAMTGWLLGLAVMRDEGPKRPQEALSFFSDTLMYHPDGPYAVASRIGSAEALAMLERHDEAIDAYELALAELESVDDPGLVSRDVLRTSLGVLADRQRQAGRWEEAVGYAGLAVALVDRSNVEQSTLFVQQLARLQSLLAAQLDEASKVDHEVAGRPIEASTAEARAGCAEAAATYLDLAHLNALNERRSSESSWQAAELYARAGERERAVNLFRAFSTERPDDPLVPRALLRIGQLMQVSGQLTSAVEAYQTCYRRFPRTLDGARALVPLAQCYLGMGPEYEDLAEKTLRVVLEDSEVFTPQAPEFAGALFLLGTVLNTRGDFERAIATLEEALERYPDDLRVWQARFLLADSYRQSGLALKATVKQTTFAGEIEQLRNESVARFQAAQRLYRQLIAAHELRDPTALNRLETMYLRHAYLYEADCFFETQDFRRALKLYEEAAGMYKDSNSALAAYVQIVNSYVFLGQPDEARAALARAIVLVDTMPDEAFDGPVSPEGRRDWKRYFAWLEQAELF